MLARDTTRLASRIFLIIEACNFLRRNFYILAIIQLFLSFYCKVKVVALQSSYIDKFTSLEYSATKGSNECPVQF